MTLRFLISHIRPRFSVPTLLCCVLGMGFLGAGCRQKTAETAPFPVKRPQPLPTLTPAQVKLDEASLATFAGEVGGNGILLRQGAQVYTWGEPAKPLDVGSASKTVLAHVVFKAVEAGKLSSLDEPVVKWLPELGQINAGMGHKDASITWRHLLNQTSCYGVAEAPGTAFDYNDFQTALLWKLIYEKVNASVQAAITEQVLRPQFFDQIEVQDNPQLRIRSQPKPNGRLIISPRDFARMGLVYLHQGTWAGKQIIPAASVAEAISSPLPDSLPRTKGVDAEMLPQQESYGGGKNQEDHLSCYSFMWWVNTQKRLWPAVPADAFAAVGHGGVKVMMVIPSLDMVVSWNSANCKVLPMTAGGREQMNLWLVKLMASVR